MVRPFFNNIYVVAIIVFTTSCDAQDKLNVSNEEFSLLSGQGIEVCDAYLKRLNKNKFTDKWPPYCDRPESNVIRGFDKLNRITLTVNEIYNVYGEVSSYDLAKNQNLFSTDHELGPDKEGSIKSIERKIRHNRLTAWRYDPMIDIDNDGQLDNVVLWRQQYESSCGYVGESKSIPSYVAYIFNKNTSLIDEAKTLEVFGDFEQVRSYAPTLKKFRRLNDEYSIGVFKYKGTTYFDTFPNGKPPNPDVDLKVYLRKDNKTKSICEYHWNKREK